MKKNSTLKLSLLVLMMIVCSLKTYAQLAQAYTSINNVLSVVYSDGTLFLEKKGNSYDPSFEVPAGGGRHTIFGSQLWIGGLDAGDQLHTAGQTYKQTGGDFWPGPLNMDGSAPNPAEWNRIWVVEKSTIEYHKANYMMPGYIVPQELLDWPGNGTGNLSHILAPFFDLDQDGLYEPADGDYPLIRGDQAIYFIVNDNYGTHTHYSGSEPLKIEVHGMVYSFTAGNKYMKESVFVNYKIINRSGETYHDVFTGQWADFDIGNAADDYCGTDVSRKMIFGYNGDADDEDGIEKGYGTSPPAQGVILLNQPLSNSMFFTNAGVQHVNNDPSDAVELYRYLRGIWADGMPLSYGGNGRGGAQAYNYSLDGDACGSSGWSETGTAATAGDRRMVGSTGPFTLAPGESIDIDLAYVYARKINSNAVCELKTAADDIIAKYMAGNITSVDRVSTTEMNIAPNPMSSYSLISFNNPGSDRFTLKVYDLRGVLIKESQNITSSVVKIDNNDLSAGSYIISLTSNNTTYRGKLIVK